MAQKLQSFDPDDFYQTITDILTFEHVTIVSRISKVEIDQILKLRMIMSVMKYPCRWQTVNEK